LRKWGEIDIICKKANIIHFVEVKTVSQVTGTQSGSDRYRPEDNFHNNKALRMKRIIETYIDEKDLNNDYRVDLITVKVNEIEAKARITFFDDVIL
jgi:Holliday junction resolvase-like predicted endonuclease